MVALESARQSKEVELKLELDPADAARIASHPALEASLTPPQKRDLISTYFDTTDFALRDARVFLRVRESGGRYVQTVKTAKSGTEFLERFEWEQEIAGSAPDLDAVEGTALAPLLTPELRASLRLLFETRIRRKTYLIERGGSQIEVAIDQGEIVAAPHRRQISELELELKRGETAELFRLARVLAETVPLRLAVKTKAERGYELLEDGKHEVEKAAEIDIGPNMPSGDAFSAIAQSSLRQIIANERAMCGGHAEALHQMRIGLRRLRAAISIFADVIADTDLDKIKAELKWITQELGPARDLDVFAADVLQPLLLAHPDDAEIALTHRDFEARRAAAYARAAGSRSGPTASVTPRSILSSGSRSARGRSRTMPSARRCGHARSLSVPGTSWPASANRSRAGAPISAIKACARGTSFASAPSGSATPPNSSPARSPARRARGAAPRRSRP